MPDDNKPVEKSPSHLSKATVAVWGGEEQYLMESVTQVPVVHSVSFGYQDVDTWREVALGERKGHIYGRNTNPTVEVFEEKVRLLEGGESAGAEAATSFSTGMAAISNTLFTLMDPGDRCVSVKDTYGGTHKIFTEFFPKFGFDVTLCNTSDFAAIEAEVAKGCKILYLETPTNPTCKVLDIERLAARAHEVGALVVVDNTFATPINQNPLQLGADLVLHSATKFLGGHADALGGVVCGPAGVIHDIYHFREINGATLHPEAAYLLLRGMKTLDLRVERQNANAMKVSRWLAAHPFIGEVFYPGLETHHNHDIARKQMRGYGGMLSFQLATDDFDAIRTFLPKLQRVHRAANLGAVETIVAPPATGSHVELTAEERAAAGIPETLVRYSAGIEHADDLIADLDQALAATMERFGNTVDKREGALQ
ncbi:MAG: cystathionine gamma-synthase family protein [Trueperaceae bacterium]